MTKPREDVPAAKHIDDGAQPRTTPMGIEPGDAYDFASDEAAEAWIAAGQPQLAPKPSGKTGYTVADVKAATEEE